MIIRSGVLALVTLGIAACSSGGSDSPASPSGAPTLPGDPFDDGFETEATPGADAPSNEELEVAGGVVTIDQARALVPGTWSYTVPGSQCVLTYSFSGDGTFVQSELDKVAGGFYRFSDDEGGLEIVYDYTTDNGRVDCFGDNEPLVEDGVTFSDFISFPDRDTLVLSGRPNGEGFTTDFVRQ